MPVELGLPKYYDFKTLKAGTKIVDMGEYIGDVPGKFGIQYKFRQAKDNQDVVVGGGSLKYRVNNGDIYLGGVYDITFEGKEVLAKGNFAGKDVNNFKVAEYKNSELADYERQYTGAVAAKAKAPASVEEALESGQNLDDLE